MADGIEQPGAHPHPNPNPNPNSFNRLWHVFQWIFIVWALQHFWNQFKSRNGTIEKSPNGSINGVYSPTHYQPLWKDGTPFTLTVYVSESSEWNKEEKTVVWKQNGLHFGWDEASERYDHVTLPHELVEHAKKNGSVWAHAFFVPEEAALNGHAKKFDKRHGTVYGRCMLNAYRPEKKQVQRKKLLQINGNNTDAEEDVAVNPNATDAALAEQPPRVLNYWKPILKLRLVHDSQVYTPQMLTSDVVQHFVIDQEKKAYYPVVYFDYFFFLSNHYMPINETTTELPLEISYYPISMTKWRMELQMEASWKAQEEWGQTEEDTEQIKRMLVESNPYLLAVTFVVSILHSIFDFLAFKNDVQFWRANRSMRGISARSIILNTGCQIVIFLYLFDNETSWVILISNGVGLAIEIWKIGKAMVVTVSSAFPFISFRLRNLGDESQEAENEEQAALRETAKYDAEAMRYLSYVLYPLVLCYSIYSLLYNTHKNWYSWILNSLVGAVYMFGFMQMCPQLYLNYKLKSVAHMNFRQMTYKLLSTVIDDLFAFVITMPTLHRVSVFRDDVIFLLFLWQRWIYKTDYTRVNEFGLSLSPEEVAKLSGVDTTTANTRMVATDNASTMKSQVDARATYNAAIHDTPSGTGLIADALVGENQESSTQHFEISKNQEIRYRKPRRAD